MDKKQRYILITFLLGVFMGAIDAGIVAPALTAIVQDFGINFKWSVWVVTIYTLIYAVSMPIIGKLADLYGRQRLFVLGIILFGIGSLLAGFSSSMAWMMVARIIQALGGGGIMPIANAVIGQSFPPEKRGMALGLVGATFGVATIIAPNLGGFIVDQLNWRWIFFINVPISIMIIVMALKIPNQVENEKKQLDWLGTMVLSIIILTLMYGLTNLEVNNVVNSLISWKVWPFLLLSIGLIYPFIILEKRADDPIITLRYFKDRNIVFALIISFITGAGMISMIFVPAFSEILLGLSGGQGGYIMTILAVASGVSAGLGGILLDKWGSKQVVILGFALSLIGSLNLAFFANGWGTLIIGLIISGFGIGFTMGAPLNYMILTLTEKEEASVALALVSLFRSIGTTIGPILLAGFITGAATKIPMSIEQNLKEKFGKSIPTYQWENGQPGFQQGGFSLDKAMDMLPDGMPTPIKQQIIEVIQETVKSTLLGGYTKLYIGSSIIFLIGIILASRLHLLKEERQVKEVG